MSWFSKELSKSRKKGKKILSAREDWRSKHYCSKTKSDEKSPKIGRVSPEKRQEGRADSGSVSRDSHESIYICEEGRGSSMRREMHAQPLPQEDKVLHHPGGNLERREGKRPHPAKVKEYDQLEGERGLCLARKKRIRIKNQKKSSYAVGRANPHSSGC